MSPQCPPSDSDTIQKGLNPPFKAPDANRVALRTVIRDAQRLAGYSYDTDFAKIAEFVLRSRWIAATQHLSQFPWFAAHLGEIEPGSCDRYDLECQAPPFTSVDRDIAMLIGPIMNTQTPNRSAFASVMTDNILNSRWYAATVAEHRAGVMPVARPRRTRNSIPDSSLHGFTQDGYEIRRHDMHGWHISGEDGIPLEEITVHRAALEALRSGRIIVGIPGGKTFDQCIRSGGADNRGFPQTPITAADAITNYREHFNIEGKVVPLELIRHLGCWEVGKPDGLAAPVSLHICLTSGDAHPPEECPHA